MCKHGSSLPITWARGESADEVLETGLSRLSFERANESVPEVKREHIVKLIARGENLDLRELEIFHQWMADSYQALEFQPQWQDRFDEYCRSSTRSNFPRLVGVWVLRMVLGAAM